MRAIRARTQGNGLAVAFFAAAQRGMNVGDRLPIALRCLGEELNHIRIWLVLDALGKPFALGNQLLDAWSSGDRIDVAILDQRQQPRDLPLYVGSRGLQLGTRPAPCLGQVLALALIPSTARATTSGASRWFRSANRTRCSTSLISSVRLVSQVPRLVRAEHLR
jgi:hypothetical protein